MSTDALDAGLLILRIAIGIVFVAHGVKHFVNREKTERWVASMGFRSPTVQWFFMTFVEIGVGLALAAGFLTSVGGAGTVALLFVAFWTVHRDAGFWITARPDEGYEYVLVLVAIGAALAVVGPGEWSVDHALGIADALDGWVGAAIFGAGFVASVGQLVLFYRPSEAAD
ncbi:MAG: DoxX family protein [Acidimicrobiia bacterium]|nr:DoxX family protein [Acidimicrobiia bacterium]